MQLKKLFLSLSIRQRLTLAFTAALLMGGFYALSHWKTERDFHPLYTGLAPEDAGAVVARLKESGVDYRLSENGSSVLVASARVAEVRLQMAAAGMPKSGRIGFELFDKTNFGSSDFAEQVNYHRALEGELERSVMALAEVEQARVHLTMPKNSVFAENRQPAKASVMVKIRYGARLAPQNVVAICHLAASAVEGLDPDAVSVLDMQGNLLSRPRKPLSPDSPEPSEATLEFKQKVERDLLAKINSTLEPLLGSEKFRAGVFVECDFTSGEQSEETLDPSRSVMVSSEKTEETSGGSTANGQPGTASNLPRPVSRAGSGSSGLSRRTESVAYQSSRSVRHVRLAQGTVKRMSVSVLLDQVVRWTGSGSAAKRVIEPATPEKIKAVHDLVAAVTGFEQNRGDQLIVESMPFEATLSAEPPGSAAPQMPPAPPAPALPPWLANLMRQKNFAVIAGAAGGGLVLVMVLLVVVLRSRSRKRATAELAKAVEAAKKTTVIETGDMLRKQMEANLAEQTAQKERQTMEAMNALKLPAPKTQKTEVLTKHISEEAQKDPTSMAQILRSWLNENE